MIHEYNDIIAHIIAELLRETKEPGVDLLPLEHLAGFVMPDEEKGVDLESILDLITTASENSIIIINRDGKRQVKVMDKISLYLMLYKLNFNMASADLLHWRDFEELVEYALQENGFTTKKNFRFKSGDGKRHEIDVVAFDRTSKEHLILLIDAKHWDHNSNSSGSRIIEAAEEQFKRAVSLGETKDILTDLLFELGLHWSNAILLPVIVTLLAPPVQNFYIPIVGILSFNNFINDFSSNVEFFKKKHVTNIPIQKRLL
ncbi:MAG: restriction endonuclease [Promethearchaeota archaeon]